jgi:hypothetical protein
MNTNAQYRCVVCRARKSRCIARHTGACERCVETGEECDLEATPPSQSPIISSTTSINVQQIRESPVRSGNQKRDADTPVPLQSTQVRVLSRAAESNLSLTTPSAIETVFGPSPIGTQPDCGVSLSGEKSPVPSEESEPAILIVEDLGRTRKFRQHIEIHVLILVQSIQAFVPTKAFFSAFRMFCTLPLERRSWIRWTETPSYVKCPSLNATLILLLMFR